MKREIFERFDRLRRAKAKAIGLAHLQWSEFFAMILKELEK